MSILTPLELEQFASALAREAGALVKPGFGTERAAVNKGKQGFATEKDIAAEKLIVSRIHERYHDHSILAEEGSTQDHGSEYTWVIDPIDGTHNYMHGVPFFAVSIGVQYRGDAIVGAIYAPMQDELYAASKGNGARRNGEPIRVSNVDTLEKSFVSVELTKRMTDAQRAGFHRLSEKVFRVRSVGSAACSLAYVASGAVDAYLDLHRSLHAWDWMAGKVLVEEAGGQFLITPDNMVVAGGPALVPQFLPIV